MSGPDYTGFQRTEFAETLAMLRYAEHAQKDFAASIIIVNYNGWHDLERCLRSLETPRAPDCEVIVIDNCSTDDSPQRIEQTFPFARLVRSGINLGFGAGNNLGAQLARGRVLVFLNPDTMVEPGWLEPLLAAVDCDPQVGVATPRILLMNDPARINTCGNDLHLSGLALCRGMGKVSEAGASIRAGANIPAGASVPVTGPIFTRNAAEARADGAGARPVQVAAISGAAFAIRSDLFATIGGFDETFFLYMEDTDLSMRVQIAGYRCVYVAESVVYHDYELNFGPMKTYYQERNRYLMLLKTLRWPTLLLLLPALILSEVVTWGFVLLRDRERIRNKLFAYAWVLFWWKEIMEKRAWTQKLRRARDRALLRQTTAHLDYGQAGASGVVTHLAHLVFDPLFAIMRWSTLALVWW